jgi:hypothetical protein
MREFRANKCKQEKANRFHLLPFVSPNLGFSKGYGRRNKKDSDSRLGLYAECLKPLSHPFLLALRPAEAGSIWRMAKVARIRFFAKTLFGGRQDSAAMSGHCARKII